MHINHANKWKMDPKNDDMSPSDTTSSAEDEIANLSNPCRICPFKSYVMHPEKDKICKIGKPGAKSCNEWARKRNMDIVFQV